MLSGQSTGMMQLVKVIRHPVRDASLGRNNPKKSSASRQGCNLVVALVALLNHRGRIPTECGWMMGILFFYREMHSYGMLHKIWFCSTQIICVLNADMT